MCIFASLRTRLMLLVLIVAIPALGLTLHVIWEEYASETQQVREETQLLIHLVSMDHRRRIDQSRFLLQTLASLPEIQACDHAASSRILAQVHRQNPLYANIALITPTGELLSSAIPYTPPVSYADREWLPRVNQTKEFTISEYLIARITKRSVVAFSYPVLDDSGEVRAVLFAGLDLDWVKQFAANVNMPEGTTITLVDRRGTILLRIPDHESWVGKTMPEAPLVKSMLSEGQGFSELTGLDGVQRLYAFAPLSELSVGSIYISAGIPSEVAYREVRDALVHMILLAVVMAMALAAAWLFGKLAVMRPINALMEVAGRMGSGDLGVRTQIPRTSGEFGRLSEAFDRMAESLERREAERRRLEDELRRSENLFRRTFDQAPIGAAIVSLDYSFHRVNAALCEMTGYSEEELTRVTFPDITHPDDLEADINFVETLAAGVIDYYRMDKRYIRKDGRIIWVDLSVRMMRDSGGEPLYFLPMIEDITDRKQAEEDLHRLNRMLRTLSECNQMLVRTTEESELVQKICQIVVDEGGYRLAWVSFCWQDEKKTVRPVAHAGFEDGHLKTLDITWADNEGGRGPTGRAIRTGELSLVVDIRTDPDYLPWRAEALRRGYLSSVALPLIADGQTLGALSLYSEKAEGFPEEELKLLRELADDLAFGIIAIRIRDEREQALERLRESEATLRVLLNASPESAFLIDPKGVVLAANLTVSQRLEKSSDELIGSCVYDLLPPDVAELRREYVQQAIQTREPVRFEDVRAGRYIDNYICPVLDAGGTVTRLALEGIDITDRKRVEETIRERERYFRSLLYSIYEDILVINNQNQITDANKDFLDTLGRKREDIIGRRCHEVLHGFDSPCNEHGKNCGVPEVFRTGLPWSCRNQRLGADGSGKWVDTLLSALRNEAGEITHVIEAMRDVTHEIKLEAQFRQAQKMEAIGTLAGGIAHDFNNILGIIVGYTEIIHFDLSADPEKRENLKQVMQACARAKDIIRQILAFSRRGEQEEPRPVFVSLLLKETLKLMKVGLPSNIEIRQTIETGPKEDMILANPSQIHQVIMNLCTNARHAMREHGGILEARLSPLVFAENDPSRAKTLEPGSYLRLSVMDTGHGMEPDIIERIFEPYFTTKGPGQGTGLGLAVAHGIVKSHGGEITVYSEPGKGTVFDVYFPRVEETPTPEIDRPAAPIPTGKETILFVDDEVPLTEVGKKMLERLGYRVIIKNNSAEALDAFFDNPNMYDVVITDLTMPGKTGIEFSKELLNIRPDIPIILCTGFSETVTSEKAKAIGIREFITKPLALNEIAGAIRRALIRSER